MKTRVFVVTLLLSAAALAADWNPRLAAQYLDGRQKEWFAWPRAASPDGPCVSCHTGLPYLLARPALRHVLGETQPTMYETGLLNRLRAKAGNEAPGALQGVETVFAALFLSRPDAEGESLSVPAKKAFEQLWSLQAHDETRKGAALWYSAGLDPWETPAAFRYGTALAALAAGSAPGGYAGSAEVRERVQAMVDYLRAGMPDSSLHNRLALLWASTRLPALLTGPERHSIIEEARQREQSDGCWTLESLGPWDAHPGAPASSGSNSYATAFTAFVLQQAGAPSPRALAWLKSHQDPQTGAWPAVSMNKHYPAGSMEEKFLQDAATGFASMALIESAR